VFDGEGAAIAKHFAARFHARTRRPWKQLWITNNNDDDKLWDVSGRHTTGQLVSIPLRVAVFARREQVSSQGVIRKRGKHDGCGAQVTGRASAEAR
jgi:hypothetical protein